MPAYGNPKSGVIGYEAGPDFIKVRFKGGSVYTYTTESAGQAAVDQMKLLAESGSGLNSYIARNVRFKYASKG